jgi:hypothetical protein
VARDLGIGAGTLGNWVKKDRLARGEDRDPAREAQQQLFSLVIAAPEALRSKLRGNLRPTVNSPGPDDERNDRGELSAVTAVRASPQNWQHRFSSTTKVVRFGASVRPVVRRARLFRGPRGHHQAVRQAS